MLFVAFNIRHVLFSSTIDLTYTIQQSQPFRRKLMKPWLKARVINQLLQSSPWLFPTSHTKEPVIHPRPLLETVGHFVAVLPKRAFLSVKKNTSLLSVLEHRLFWNILKLWNVKTDWVCIFHRFQIGSEQRQGHPLMRRTGELLSQIHGTYKCKIHFKSE